MKKNIKFNIFVTIIFLCVFFSIFLLNIFSNRVMPIFIKYTESEIRNISTIIINRAISNHLSSFSDIDEMVIISKNDNNEIQMIDFDTTLVNTLLKTTTDSVLESLKSIEDGSDEIFSNNDIGRYNGGIIYEVPIGVVSNNLFFGNLGPKIPVKLNIIGDVFSNVKTEVLEYGINNALIKISINVTVSEKILVPFISETITVSCDVPISLKVIQGNIPIYYGNGISKGSNILSIPTE